MTKSIHEVRAAAITLTKDNVADVVAWFGLHAKSADDTFHHQLELRFKTIEGDYVIREGDRLVVTDLGLSVEGPRSASIGPEPPTDPEHPVYSTDVWSDDRQYNHRTHQTEPKPAEPTRDVGAEALAYGIKRALEDNAKEDARIRGLQHEVNARMPRPAINKGEKRLVLTLATRGRPDLLKWTVEHTVPNLRRDNTVILIACDNDDTATWEMGKYLTSSAFTKVELSIRPREDTIAEKWNRGIACYDADAYGMMVDYGPFVTPGFDQNIMDTLALFPDGIGVAVGDLENLSFTKGQVATRRLVELMGGELYPECFPYWFVDHWLDDLAQMIGRRQWCEMKCDTTRRPGTQGLCEPGFWANLYDGLQPERHRIANAVIDVLEEPDWRKTMLRQHFAYIDQHSKMINDIVRHKKYVEAVQDERYGRVKQSAVDMMNTASVPRRATA